MKLNEISTLQIQVGGPVSPVPPPLVRHCLWLRNGGSYAAPVSDSESMKNKNTKYLPKARSISVVIRFFDSG